MVPHVTAIRGAETMHTRSSLPPTCTSEVRAVLSRNTSQTSEEPMEDLGLLSWLLRRPPARHRVWQLERTRREDNQRLAWRVQDIIAGRGLTQVYYSIGNGRGWHVPQVVSVLDGPPVGLDIRTLPGQAPDDFVKHAPAIAYNLGVAEVRVVPLGPSMIRLELLPEPS
jgi:hypothetical protein